MGILASIYCAWPDGLPMLREIDVLFWPDCYPFPVAAGWAWIYIDGRFFGNIKRKQAKRSGTPPLVKFLTRCDRNKTGLPA